MMRYLIGRGLKKLRVSAIRASTIHPTAAIESACQVVETTIQKHSFCGHDCVLLRADIGAFCSIADRVCIGGSAHPMHFVSTSPAFLERRDSIRAKFAAHRFLDFPRTKIGNDVWIGFGAMVLSGVSIGHGAVVGMGAVVSADVHPYDIVVGNPARVVRSRFDPHIVRCLLASAWWDMEEEDLAEKGFLFSDPVAFLRNEKLL